MDGALSKLTVAMVCCLLAAGGSGCSSRSWVPSWMPFSHQVEHLPGVPSPSERIANLQKLADKASATDVAQKGLIAQDLAKEIQKEEDSMVRAEILRALAAYGGPAAEPVLRAALNDPDADVRVVACAVWGKRGDAEAARLLGGVLSSDIDKDVRMAAARALGQSHDPAAVAALGTALEDADPAMQHRAMFALRQVSGQDFGNDVDRWRQYVKNGAVKPDQSPTFAEKLRRWTF